MNGVGTDQGFLDWELRGHGTAEITNVVVKSEHRRQGVGTGLVLKALNAMRSARVRYVYLFTELSNVGAQLFYEAQGFKRLRVIEGLYERGDGVLYGMVIREEGGQPRGVARTR